MSENESYFGESYKMKDEKRLDVLHPAEDTPNYVEHAWDVRTLLQTDGEKHGWGEMPQNIASVESFFDAVKERVAEGWRRAVQPELDIKLVAWGDELESKSGDPSLVALLRDPDAFEAKLNISQFGVLEALRGPMPEVWRELVLLASERQLAAIAVAKRWMSELSSDEARSAAVQEMGLETAGEMDIFLDLSIFMGKFIDHAYVKQIELADAAGGQMKTPGEETFSPEAKKGLKYVYDISNKDTEAIDIHPYVEVFPQEMTNIGKHFKRIAEKVRSLLSEGKIGRNYVRFPEYLNALSEAYASTTTDPEKVYAEWQKALTLSRELAQEGCPIMLIPQAAPGVAGDANKVDVELRLGLQTKETVEFQQRLKPFIGLADGYLESIRGDLEKSYSLPPILVNYQPFAFGPNTYWKTRGESGTTQIVAHNNAVIEVAKTKARPAFERVFADRLSDEEFGRATVLDNTLHEIGHALVPADDTLVRERTGLNQIVEELKADSGDMKLVHMALEAGNTDVDPRLQLIAKLGDICDYLQNKSPNPGTSGERYYYDGVAILSTLFETGILEEGAQGLVITDPRRGIAEVAKLADTVLSFYRGGTPEQLANFSQELRKKAEDPRIVSVVSKLKM